MVLSTLAKSSQFLWQNDLMTRVAKKEIVLLQGNAFSCPVPADMMYLNITCQEQPPNHAPSNESPSNASSSLNTPSTVYYVQAAPPDLASASSQEVATTK